MSDAPKDCWSCRLSSGGGLLFGGVFVLYQSRKVKKLPQGVAAIGYALCFFGFLRIFNLPPFRKSRQQIEEKPENGEPRDYIVGKYPTKIH